MKQYKDTSYLVDTEGNVYRDGRKIKQFLVGNYYVIGLHKNGFRKQVKIHRLVAETYIPNPENKPQVNHINGIRTDNRVENLEWATALENTLHSINVLGKNRGKNSCKSILTEEQVLEIRQKYSTGNYNQRRLAKEYNVSQSNIGFIVRNETWKHI